MTPVQAVLSGPVAAQAAYGVALVELASALPVVARAVPAEMAELDVAVVLEAALEELAVPWVMAAAEVHQSP